MGLVATVLVGFLLTPLVVRELGYVGYGFWALLQSLLSYMFLLEFGVRASLNRIIVTGKQIGRASCRERV